MVQTGVQKQVQIFLVGKLQTIAEKTGNLPVLLGMGNQVRQVIAQGWFAPGEDHMWDTNLPGFVEDGLPLDGIQFTFNDRFADAESLYSALSDSYPASPMGPLFAAATVHAQMLDSESPQRRDELLRWLNLTRDRAERWRAAEPGSGEAEFALGTVLGYQAVYESRWGGWFAALKQGLRSKNRFAAALKKDSSLIDAFLGVGNYNYWKSAKTDFINWTGIISDDRQEGLAQLQKAAVGGTLTRAPARVSLAWALINEGRNEEALAHGDSLATLFPGGKGPLWIMALADFGLYRWEQSRTLYAELERRLLAEGPGNYFNLIDCAYFCALCDYGLGRWRGTLDDCHRGLAYPAPPDILERQKSKLKKLRDLQSEAKRKTGLEVTEQH